MVAVIKALLEEKPGVKLNAPNIVIIIIIIIIGIIIIIINQTFQHAP